MVNSVIKKLKDDGKYIAIVFLVLIILSGLISPLVINYKRNNWDVELSNKIAEIENAIQSSFRQRELNLIQTEDWLKQNLSETFKSKSYQYKELIELVNNTEKKSYSLEIVAPNGKLIAWNQNIAITQEEIFPLSFPLGQAYFHTTGLLTYLTIVDTIRVQTDVFYIVVGEKFEKHYSLQNDFYTNESFVTEFSEEFRTQIFIDFNPFALPEKDGRIYSFQLNNLKGSKIGVASFYKPSLNVTISGIRDITTKIQASLVVLVCIFIGVSFRNDFLRIKRKSVRLLLIVIYLTAFRVLIFVVGFPSLFLSGPLVDPANFSSTFAWGLVKSPIEFFITNSFLIIISFQIFKYNYHYSVSDKSVKWKIRNILSIPALLIICFYLLRGLSASIKSVIFDSTIRYFKDPTPIPDFTTFFMNLNVLMLGLSIMVVMVSFIILSGKFSHLLDANVWLLKFTLMFILVQLFAYYFFENLNDPLITHLMVFIFISLMFILVYSIYFRKHTIFQSLVYLTIASSIITVILMNYFNLELEKRSLKTVAFEIIRANETLLNYMSDETLLNALVDDELINSFYQRNINFDAEAFRIWCTTPMQNESISSGIFLYDRDRVEIGSFSVGLENQYNIFSYFDSVNTDEPNIKEINDSQTSEALTTIGIMPVKKRDIIGGYVSTAAQFNINSIGAKNIPDFLKSNNALIGSVIDESFLTIFEFTNSKITQVYGDIYPSREQMIPIANAKLSRYNDASVDFSIYGEDYISYVIKVQTNGSERLITVAAKAREITWNLFNFFKIFLIHTIFILALFLTLKITNLLKIKRSFRTKLLYVILFVSIVPLALLAVYNRQVVSERSQEEIFDELSKRSDYLENHVRSQLAKHQDRILSAAFSNVGKELNISFSVYKNTDLIYSSHDDYYRIGLFHYKLNPEAHYNLNYLSYKEYSAIENIDKYNFDAYYRKITINGDVYIIGVNDAFNKIKPTFSTADVDVILFGIYSFAVIIIIIVSTILANQISAPIRKLTKATEAVAQGDLSVELENTEKGEMKDLYDGFNLMTHELQKNQVEIAELERESAWKEMAKQVAHEIKNPLTPVKLAIQQLVASYNEKSKDFDKTFDAVTKTTLSQIDNLSQIASEFSSFAKMPSIKLEEVNLLIVIYDIVSLFKDNVDVKFSTDVQEAIVESDISQLKRMLINIIRNSIQANASKITLKLSEKENDYSLLIKDNGNGIEDKHKNEIFKMNFTTKEKGMGIGLKLSKRFIESSGGKIHLVKSQPSDTIFQVIIPKFKSKNDLS